MLSKYSFLPAGGGFVPSTSAGIRLWPRYRLPVTVVGLLKHCGDRGVPPVSILVRSKAQTTTPTSL